MATTFTYAEELQLQDLRSLVLRRLRVYDTTRYSPTQGAADYDWIDDAINTGLKKFVRATKCLRAYAVYVPLASYQAYRCPESFVDLKAAYYYSSSFSDGYKELAIKTVGWLNSNVSDWRTATGTPEIIYIDRMFGRRWFFGLVPIPSTAGTTVAFDTTYGTHLTEICNLTTYNEEFIELPQVGEYYCPTDQASPGMPIPTSTMNNNLLLEHYRLPRQLDTNVQYPELPREYHETLADYAAYELLRHNPEDSAEFKRAPSYLKAFNDDIDSFKESRKPSRLIGAQLKGQVAAHTFLEGMSWRKALP